MKMDKFFYECLDVYGQMLHLKFLLLVYCNIEGGYPSLFCIYTYSVKLIKACICYQKVNIGLPKCLITDTWFSYLDFYSYVQKRYRLPCAFPPKKLRNNTSKVLETRKNQLEQYLQAFVKQCQKSYIPLPQVLLDFLQVSIHVPKIAIERADSRLDDRIEAASHRSIVGFVSKEPFLFESSHALQVSHTGLPDIVTQGTLQCFY